MSCRHLPQGQLLHCGEISKWMQSHTTIGKGRLSKCVLCLSLSTSLSLFSVLLSLISAPPETLSLSRAHSLILSRAWPPDSRVAYSHKKSIFFYFEANPVFNIELVKSNEQKHQRPSPRPGLYLQSDELPTSFEPGLQCTKRYLNPPKPTFFVGSHYKSYYGIIGSLQKK